MCDVELFVFVDEQGDYAIGRDSEETLDSYRENIGDVAGPGRMVRVCLKVPLPALATVSGVVPAQSVPDVVLKSA